MLQGRVRPTIKTLHRIRSKALRHRTANIKTWVLSRILTTPMGARSPTHLIHFTSQLIRITKSEPWTPIATTFLKVAKTTWTQTWWNFERTTKPCRRLITIIRSTSTTIKTTATVTTHSLPVLIPRAHSTSNPTKVAASTSQRRTLWPTSSQAWISPTTTQQRGPTSTTHRRVSATELEA